MARVKKINAISDVLDSDTWSSRYLLHKYWARKPANVVRQYIEHYTRGLDQATVLDPFCGSGVTAVEAVALGKNAIAVDLNPIACLITKVTAVGPVDIDRLDSLYRSIMAEVQAELGWLYQTECAACGNAATIHSIGWDGPTPVEVRYTCDRCGNKRSTLTKPVSQWDIDLIGQIEASEIPYWYPDVPVFKGWQTLKLKRAGMKSFAELYTRRNLWALAAIWHRISQVPDAHLREILAVTFTSVLAQGTKMIADFKANAGGPSWKINTFWVPSKWQELNVFRFFGNRYEKMRKAKVETNLYIGEKFAEGRSFQVFNVSSTNLTPMESDDPSAAVLAPESVDYVFTDPPYGGESIQYMELSALWNMWLMHGEIPFDGEVIFNPHRGLDQAYYDRMLAKVFRQVYLALRPNRWMSITFHNKESVVWNALLTACAQAGFVLESIVPLNASAPNLTQKLTKGAPKTDLILNFRKPGPGEVQQVTFDRALFRDFTSVVVDTAMALIAREGFTTTGRVFDQVVMKWFTTFFGGPSQSADEPEMNFMVSDVEGILAAQFQTAEDLVENAQVRERGDTHWVLRA
ncbi:MAG TPA: DNA methyltransferase [Symbiobacteriaceae bacterium]|nr:DNA methyltransferase [Symbiobacteriaceae bacterium]